MDSHPYSAAGRGISPCILRAAFLLLLSNEVTLMSASIPRPEYPKPQFRRSSWQNLNGSWAFEIDNGRSGLARGLAKEDASLSGSITVPFCPQSKLSGLAHTDFIYGVWYQKTVQLSAPQLSGIVRLHIGAADYYTTVYVNGQKAGSHKGGYTSFFFDIQSLAKEGDNVITINVEDDERDPMIPCGKQSREYYSHDCDYTRTTGIWQTVWLEFIPITHIESFRLIPQPDQSLVTITAQLAGPDTLTVSACWQDKEVGSVSVNARGGALTLTLPLSEKHLWELGKGGLYDLKLTYGDDTVYSYFGLRSVELGTKAFRLNGKVVFQRTVLDQGFYPDGIYTAPSDQELKNDILRSMAMGFNGARLHQKVFEERFLYHADQLGYLVWGEFPSWGLDHTQPQAVYSILPQWLEEIGRDFNHPSIIGWCPFNETWDQHDQRQYDPLLSTVYYATKAADPTRPCIDTSGNFHVATDIFDLHDYEQDVETFRSKFPPQGGFTDNHKDRQTYGGQPVFMSEYGGIGYSLNGGAWSYGSACKSQDEYIARFKGLTEALMDDPDMIGLCYTQLTDVEQEQNGVYTYDRVPKVDPAVFHQILSRPAAIERAGRNSQ